jgi:hypothetical protein
MKSESCITADIIIGILIVFVVCAVIAWLRGAVL